MQTIIRQDKLILKGSPVGAENPQPFFRQADTAVASGPNLPEEKNYSFGRETGARLLPYTRQDRYNRKLIDMEFSSIVMENDFLKAEFVPALGGRLIYLFDKKQNRDILYRNPMFRPANLAIRDAWFSGGIEWNIGRYGHTVHTCDPVFAGTFESDGFSILRFWEFERQSRLYWRIEFILLKDSAVLFSYVRIENTDNIYKPLYWWTNAAIPQTPGVRVFSACDDVIFIVPGSGKVKTMDYGKLPQISVLPGKDATYPVNSGYANEYFFQNEKIKSNPWEAAVYEDGYAYGEMSTFPLTYRKMFCWGQGRGGKHWQDFLSLPGQEYLEVQSGLAPTQLHTADIGAGEVIDWVQVFTSFQTEADTPHQKDYSAAREYVADCLTKHIDSKSLQYALEQGRKRSGMEANIINMGSGWGTLESRLRQTPPAGLVFPNESIGIVESPWAELLRTGVLPKRSPKDGPGSFVIDGVWEECLSKSPDDDWLVPYHLGVIYFEQGNAEKAVNYWKESIKRKENAWSLRNLGVAAVQAGDFKTACEYYSHALVLEGGQDQSFAEEYIPLLLSAGKESEAAAELDAYLGRVGSLEALSVPLMDAAARIALNRGNHDLLDKIFSMEQVHIREGNNAMIEIWIESEIRKLCDKGFIRTQAHEQIHSALVSGALLPPPQMDFRMYNFV